MNLNGHHELHISSDARHKKEPQHIQDADHMHIVRNCLLPLSILAIDTTLYNLEVQNLQRRCRRCVKIGPIGVLYCLQIVYSRQA